MIYKEVSLYYTFVKYGLLKALTAISALLFQLVLMNVFGSESAGKANFLIVTAISISFLILPGAELAAYNLKIEVTKDSDYIAFVGGISCILFLLSFAFLFIAPWLPDDVYKWLVILMLALLFWSSKVLPMLERVFGSPQKSILYEPGIFYLVSIVISLFFSISFESMFLMSSLAYSSIILIVVKSLRQVTVLGFIEYLSKFLCFYRRSHVLFSLTNYLTIYGILQFCGFFVSSSEFANLNLFVRWIFIVFFFETIFVSYFMPKYLSGNSAEKQRISRVGCVVFSLFSILAFMIIFIIFLWGSLSVEFFLGTAAVVVVQWLVVYMFFPFYRFSILTDVYQLKNFALIFVCVFSVLVFFLYFYYSFFTFVIVLCAMQFSKNILARFCISRINNS